MCSSAAEPSAFSASVSFRKRHRRIRSERRRSSQTAVFVSDAVVWKSSLQTNLFSKVTVCFGRITGFVSQGDHGVGRSATDRQFFFINNRPCDPLKVKHIYSSFFPCMYNLSNCCFMLLSVIWFLTEMS